MRATFHKAMTNPRCILGGPFEYWLRRTRAQNISDDSVIDDCIASLINGHMPTLLRRHSRAAAGMPSS
jgi:hypothetical protein